MESDPFVVMAVGFAVYVFAAPISKAITKLLWILEGRKLP